MRARSGFSTRNPLHICRPCKRSILRNVIILNALLVRRSIYPLRISILFQHDRTVLRRSRSLNRHFSCDAPCPLVLLRLTENILSIVETEASTYGSCISIAVDASKSLLFFSTEGRKKRENWLINSHINRLQSNSIFHYAFAIISLRCVNCIIQHANRRNDEH